MRRLVGYLWSLAGHGWGWVRPRWQAILSIAWPLRVSVLFAVLAYVLSAGPPQAREAWVVLAENAWWSSMTILGLAVALACTVHWYWSRWLLDELRSDAQGPTLSPESIHAPTRERMRTWMPRVLGVSPALGLVAGATGAWRTVPMSADALHNLKFLTAIGLIGTFVLVGLWIIRRRLINQAHFNRLQWLRNATLYGSAAIGVTVVLAFWLRPSQVGDRWPPAGLAALFAIVWLPPLTFLIRHAHPKKFPVLTALLLWAGVWGWFNTNDNHAIRALKTGRAPQQIQLGDAFASWLASRPDRLAYKDRPYPVYLVCAEGGGIYAAYFTAQVLARLQDADARFADHVFAISGVSGGSVGATVFTGLVDEARAGKLGRSYSQGAHEVLAANLLTPVVGAALFPDTLQRWIPWPIESMDRARALEVSLERSWRRHVGTDRLKESFYRLGLGGPYLCLSTTEVETGRRIVVSQLGLLDEACGNTMTLHDPDLAPNLDFRASTAAFLSARFPYVTPVATVQNNSGHSMRLADGGYFENHGAATLLNILNGLRPSPENAGAWRVMVIRIGTRVRHPYDTRGRAAQSPVLSELFAPVTTSMQTRSARGESAVNDLRQATHRLMEFCVPCDFQEVLLDTEATMLPLGWLLSDAARERIKAQVGVPVASDTMVTPPQGPVDNSHTLARILEHLKPEAP